VTAAGVAGAGELDASPALAAMACPWDCVGLGTEDEVIADTFVQLIRQQWACGVQGDFKGGEVFHSRTDSAGQIAAYAMGRNNPEEVVVPVRTGYKYPGYVMAAATTSRVCCTACYDPARPVQYDNGFLGHLYDSAQCATIWSSEEKKAFYDAGVLNWDVAFTRGVRQTALWIEEPLTTYKYDPNTGAPDGAWQRVESRYTVVKFVRELGYWYRRNYASVALVSDGTRIPQGRRAISPRILQASIIAWLRSTQLGITAEADDERLEKMVQVQRTNTPDNCDPNRVNVLIDLDLVNQLARIATSIDVSPEFACLPPTVAAA
jgi:phage tail sheath gpL-like